MFEHHKQLQEQFKVIHKEVDALRSTKSRPGELRKEITQMEEEAAQLVEKIAALKKKTAGESGFKDVLEATSALRKEQEEQAKLAERKRDQMLALSLVEKRARESEARLLELRSALRSDTSPDQLFDHLQTQVARNQDLLMHKFPQEFRAQQENLQRVEKALSEPPKTEHDIADMEDEIGQLRSMIQQYQAQVAEAQRANGANGGDDKLAIFRQHASVQAKKLSDKEEEAQRAQQDKTSLLKQIESTEAKLAEIARSAGGAGAMSREEFKQYSNMFRNKTAQHKKVKAELAELASESVVLHRTEQLLKSRSADLEGFLKDLEAKRGIAGFLETHEKLDAVSAMNAQINQLKGETLEEISRVVTDLNQTLKERKNQLAPQIKELRAVRQKYQETEQVYLDKKAQYDATAVGLEAERLKLEQECSAFQDDCLREESQFHLLHCQLEIERARADKVAQEVEFESGSGGKRLLRDIRSFQELYKHKVAQQESLTKELRKQQKMLKTSAGDRAQQKDMFEHLAKLLSCKVRLASGASSNSGSGGMGVGGMGGGVMSSVGMGGIMGRDLFDGHADIAQFDVGGANVMTLDD